MGLGGTGAGAGLAPPPVCPTGLVVGLGPVQADRKAMLELELGLMQAGLEAVADHGIGAGARAREGVGEVQGLCQQEVAGQRAVALAELVDGERGRQAAGVGDLDAVMVDGDLHGGAAGVVLVDEGVDDGLAEGLLGDLVLRQVEASGGRPIAFEMKKLVWKIHSKMVLPSTVCWAAMGESGVRPS